MSEALTPEAIQEAPVPEDANPNQLLAYIAEQSRKQTQGMKILAYHMQQLTADNRLLVDELRDTYDLLSKTERETRKTRAYIAFAFWLFIGIPLLIGAGFVLLTLAGAAMVGSN